MDGQPIAVERFDPRNVSFESRDGTRVSNHWTQFLVTCLAYNRPIGSFHSMESFRLTWPSLRPFRFAFFSPFLFRSYDLGYVSKTIVPRHVKLSLDELQRVAKVKCELTFRAGSDDKTK